MAKQKCDQNMCKMFIVCGSACLPTVSRLTVAVPTHRSPPSSRRGPTVEEEGVGVHGLKRPAAHLGPRGHCEDAVCPGGPHCGGEGL